VRCLMVGGSSPQLSAVSRAGKTPQGEILLNARRSHTRRSRRPRWWFLSPLIKRGRFRKSRDRGEGNMLQEGKKRAFLPRAFIAAIIIAGLCVLAFLGLYPRRKPQSVSPPGGSAEVPQIARNTGIARTSKRRKESVIFHVVDFCSGKAVAGARVESAGAGDSASYTGGKGRCRLKAGAFRSVTATAENYIKAVFLLESEKRSSEPVVLPLLRRGVFRLALIDAEDRTPVREGAVLLEATGPVKATSLHRVAGDGTVVLEPEALEVDLRLVRDMENPLGGFSFRYNIDCPGYSKKTGLFKPCELEEGSWSLYTHRRYSSSGVFPPHA